VSTIHWYEIRWRRGEFALMNGCGAEIGEGWGTSAVGGDSQSRHAFVPRGTRRLTGT